MPEHPPPLFITHAKTWVLLPKVSAWELDYCNCILNREINKRSELHGQGCDPLSTILQCYTFVKIPTLTPCSIQKKYKICTLVYKVIRICQPVYLHKHLNRTRNLRSSDDDQLVPRVISKMGERAFSVAAHPALELYPSWELYISGSTNWNGKRTMITSLIRICSVSELGTPRI